MTAPAAEGQPPELAIRLERAIDRVVWTRSGPLLAALRVLGEPDVAAGLAAARLLAEIDAEHQSHRWAPDSATVVCTAGCGAYPCRTRERIDGTRQP